MVYDVKKGLLKSGEILKKIRQIIFEKNAVVQWKRVGVNLRYNFWNWGGNSEQKGNV